MIGDEEVGTKIFETPPPLTNQLKKKFYAKFATYNKEFKGVLPREMIYDMIYYGRPPALEYTK
jgi:hypothetical protein